eukprot:CAMPEP_0174917748 /NCGR_PEP_ID=MMETSP1355-20121228/2653_1 /TAXON_ID=464990 /ORGANISM="Hemiselmis tepida, Strain CCMP443" /LENGTH=114 /DNA_ID=CAMNT_0016162875 /DNA_START=99 /DNA_END=443 /DNA_ORIENTATION=-
MTAAQMAEDMAFGGQRVTRQAYPAQRSGGMRISQRKKAKRVEAAETPTLPNPNLGEKVSEIDLGIIKVPEDSSSIYTRTIGKRLKAQTPKMSKGFSNRPNPRSQGPLMQPKPGY